MFTFIGYLKLIKLNTMRYLLILVFTCIYFYTFSQDSTSSKDAPVNGWELREKYDKKSAKEDRDKFLKGLQDKHAQYFNVPQGKWYIGARAGYGIPFLTVNRRNIETYLGVSDYYENEAGEISDKTIVTNDAKGFRSAFFFGYRINPYLAVEMDLSFTSYANTLQGRVVSPDLTSELFTKGRDFSIMPQVVLISPEVGNFSFYGKFGFHLPVYGNASGNPYINDYNGTFLRGIASNSDLRFYNIADVIAEFLGENVAGLGFLDEGYFKAIGYHFEMDAVADIDFRVNQDAIGYTASIGTTYQLSPLVGLMAEIRIGGYNVTTKSYRLSNVDGRLDLNGIQNYLVLNDDGATFYDGEFIPAEELAYFYQVNYHYELNENSNNAKTNPNGVDPTLPSDRLGLRRSTFATSINVGVQINFKGKKDKKENK